MPDGPPIRTLIGLAPSDSVAAWEARTGRQTTVRWHEMWQEEHARAFTVAKVARLDILNMLHSSIDDVARNGGTFEQWRAAVQPELEKAGWWGRVEDASLTGTDEPVIIGPRRLRTIYETNMRVSRAAGQWARIQRYKDDRPFLRYVTMGDDRVRHQHQLWHGLILPVDHAWWHTHFPPNDWGCRCTVQQWSQRDLDRRGWTVSKAPPPEEPPRKFYRAGRSEPVKVPAGIGPGWAYNPGQASLASIGEKAVQSIDEALLTGNAEAGRETLQELVDGRAFETALASFTRRDTAGRPLPRELAEKASFPLVELDHKVRAAIGARTAVGRLSADGALKQLKEHPEIGVDAYRLARSVAEAPDHRWLGNRQRHAVLAKHIDGRWIRVVVKSGGDGEEAFVVSVHEWDAKEVARAARTWTAIASTIGALILPEQDPVDEE